MEPSWRRRPGAAAAGAGDDGRGGRIRDRASKVQGAFVGACGGMIRRPAVRFGQAAGGPRVSFSRRHGPFGARARASGGA